MSFLYTIIGWIMKMCYSISFNNYILTLFIFALVMQIILFPFGIKQQKSTVKRASLRPKEEEIMRRYRGRNDRETQQKMQMEIQEMYKAEGYSPTAGCLPLLIQFPIIISLFGVVRAPLTYTTDLNSTKVGENGYNLNDFYQQAYKVIDNQIEAYQNRVDYLKANEPESEKIEEYESKISSLKTTKLSEDKKSGIQSKSESYRELKLIKFMQDGVDTFNADCLADDQLVIDGSTVTAYYDENKTAEDYDNAGFIGKLVIKEDAIAKQSGEKVYDFNDMLADKGIYTDKDKKDGIVNGAHCLPNFEFIGSTSILDQPSYKKFNWLLIIPVLVFLSSFWSGEVSRKFAGQTTANGQDNPMNGGMMRWGMPLMSTVFAFTFPAAIGIYWTVRSVVSVGQQYLLAKMFPAPVFTESEIREAVKEVKQAKKRKKLVTIEVDEDDTSYDDIAISEERAEKIRRRQERIKKENEAKTSADKKDGSGIEKPPLKDEQNGKD